MKFDIKEKSTQCGISWCMVSSGTEASQFVQVSPFFNAFCASFLELLGQYSKSEVP